MALKLVEGAVTELNTYFQANMAAKLTALNTEYNDSITLDPIAAYYLGEMSLSEVPQFPAVFILGRGTQIERYTPTMTDAGHDIDIGVIVLDQNSETVQRRLYRYMRAFWELVIERFFASTADDYYTEQGARMRFSPTYSKDKSGPYLADAILTARFGKAEDKP